MREAMARAEVGDDVLGEDPTARALEEEIARVTGKEAALFVSSGTMGNQLAIATQTRPGDDVVVGAGAHLVYYESGAGAALSGVQFSPAGKGGFYTPDEMEAAIQPRALWAPRTALVAIENTHNRAGGRLWPAALAVAVAGRARALGLATHMDGARLWNASAATGLAVDAMCAPFDTVNVCFSKGLGAPVGSAFCAPRALVEEARRLRKRWGGAMRQVGVLAAAALYALSHHRERLGEDHENARALAEGLQAIRGIRVDPALVETNIVHMELEVPAEPIARIAREAGVLVQAAGPRLIRAVTHLDVSRADVAVAIDVLARAVAAAAHPDD